MRARLHAMSLAVGMLAAACLSEESPVRRARPPEPGTVALSSEEIPLHDQPLAVTRVGSSLWVTTGGDRLLHLNNDEILGRFRTGVSRVGIAAAAGRLWVAGGGDGAVPNGTLLGIDPTSGEAVQRIRFTQESPYGVAAGRAGIFTALFQGDLIRIHPGGDATARIPLGYGLTEVLVAHGLVWVSSPHEGKVWRVAVHDDDTGAAATELRSTEQNACPQGLDASPTAVWAVDPCAGKVWLLDPHDGTVLADIADLGRKPLDIDISGGRAWIVDSRDGIVSVVDLHTMEVIARGQAGARASAIVAHGRDAWVTNPEADSLTHLELPA